MKRGWLVLVVEHKRGEQQHVEGVLVSFHAVSFVGEVAGEAAQAGAGYQHVGC